MNRKHISSIVVVAAFSMITGMTSLARDNAPMSQVFEEIPELASIAVETQEWNGKALANTDGEIAIMSEASQESSVVGKMYSNTIVSILEKGEIYSKVVSGEVVGYVENTLLAFGVDAVERAKIVCPKVAVPNTEDVSFRSEPNETGDVHGYAETDSSYTVLEDVYQVGEEQWIKIQASDDLQAYMTVEDVTISRNLQDAKSIEQIQAEEAAKKAAEEAAAREAAQKAAEESQRTSAQSVSASADDQTLLAALIYCEAGNQLYDGQVAVGAVVLNRVRSDRFPNTIRDVIYQKGQFGPAITGKLDRVLAEGRTTDTAYQAAADALVGANPIGSALFFGNGDYGQKLGDHWFH